MKSLEILFKEKYPNLLKDVDISYKNNECFIKINFLNPRYFAWLMEQDGLIVGINTLHNHFDSSNPGEEYHDAFEYFDEIINGNIVAVGKKNKKDGYCVASMGKDDALKKYSNNKQLDIVAYDKIYN